MRFDDLAPAVGEIRTVAGDARTLPDMFLRRVALTPEGCALRHKADGHWRGTSWAELGHRTRAIATWLAQGGLALGDTVTIMGRTCREWLEADLAGQLAGAVTVGAYSTLTADQLAYQLAHSDTKAVFVQGEHERACVEAVRDRCPALRHVVVWEPGAEAEGSVAFEEAAATTPDDALLAERSTRVDPSACAIIVYTSGTTGPPKGAMISHRNILTVLRSPLGIEQGDGDETLSFLPLAHVAERILGTYNRINYGGTTAYASSIAAVLEEVKEVRPTVFGSVPRIFEKAFDKIQAGVEDASPLKRRLFRWAEGVGLRAVDRWQSGRRIGRRLSLQHALADRVVFRRIREAFGGRVRFFVTGAAPIPDRVLRFFWGAGFKVFEAYGMTEGTVISHINTPGRTRLGSVGKPMPYAEHRIADDGEILVRGEHVFLGYHKNEAATQEAVDDEGWLHTGDIGRIDGDGFLYIVDRKKHIIITAGGKNLTPANIENAIKAEDPIISHVHAHGDRRPYVTALVTLSPAEAIDWAVAHGAAAPELARQLRAELAADPFARPDGLAAVVAKVSEAQAIRERIRDAVRRGNERLSRMEQVKRVALLERELSVADDELTPTMKVRRKAIEKKFERTFARLYDDPDFGVEVVAR